MDSDLTGELLALERRRDAALRYMRRAAPPARQTGERAQQIRWHFSKIEQALTGTSWAEDDDGPGDV